MNPCISFLLISAVVGLLPACGRGPETPVLPTPGPARVERKPADADSWPVEVVDSLGRKVTLARLPERIVSLAPSNTEILHAVGAARQVIGGTTFDN